MGNSFPEYVSFFLLVRVSEDHMPQIVPDNKTISLASEQKHIFNWRMWVLRQRTCVVPKLTKVKLQTTELHS